MSRSQLGKGRSLQAGEALFRRRDFRWITTEDRVYAEFRDRRAYSVCVDGLESRLVCRRLDDAVVSEGRNSVSVFRVKSAFLLAAAMRSSNHIVRRVIRTEKRRQLLRAEHV